MQSDNKLFEDFSKLMNGLAGTMAGMGREAQENGRERFRSWLGGFDFVGRDEFDAVKAMATKALDEVDALRAELAALKAAPSPLAHGPGEPEVAERAG